MELMVQGRDIPWLMAQWVERTPDKVFLIWAPPEGKHQQWTYREFDNEVRKLAKGFTEQGWEKDQRLLIHMENCPELLMTYMAWASPLWPL